ncbi:unnamed protein product, partial [Symbiodinium sp. KB8]
LSGGTRVEAGVLAAIHKHWSTLDAKLQEELTAQGLQVKPPQKEAGDLQEACRQHLASLPESVRKLVQEPKQEPTYGEAVSDLNKKFKLETSQLRDLVQQSITLQERIDKAKQSYEELLRSMQALTEKLQTKQAEVEALQKQLQSKLSESDVPPAKPEEGQTFDAFFAALEKAGLQLDEAQRNKVREQLAEPPHLEVQVKKRRLEEGTGEVFNSITRGSACHFGEHSQSSGQVCGWRVAKAKKFCETEGQSKGSQRGSQERDVDSSSHVQCEDYEQEDKHEQGPEGVLDAQPGAGCFSRAQYWRSSASSIGGTKTGVAVPAEVERKLVVLIERLEQALSDPWHALEAAQGLCANLIAEPSLQAEWHDGVGVQPVDGSSGEPTLPIPCSQQAQPQAGNLAKVPQDLVIGFANVTSCSPSVVTWRGTVEALQWKLIGAGYEAIGVQAQGLTYTMISLYLKDTEGPTGPRNAQILASLVAYVRELP